MENAESLLVKCPLVSPEEAAGFMDVDVSTARRRLAALRQQGLATYHQVGRVSHREQRWVLTHTGVERQRYPPEDPWWLTESGIRTLLSRVEQLRNFYRMAPGLFRHAGLEWHKETEVPRLIDWVLLRKSRFIGAFGTYTGDIRIFFCWVGLEVRRAALMKRWEERFSGLETYSEAEDDERRRNDLVEQRDPDYDPTPRPSGYVVVGADEWACYLAYRTIPRAGRYRGPQPFLFVSADDLEEAMVCEEVVRRAPYDMVADIPEIEIRKQGRPQKLVRPDQVPHPEDLLGDVLPAMALELVEEWLGLREQDIARRCRRTRKQVEDVVRRMLENDWLVEIGGMLYLGPRGCLYAARRDRVSPGTVRTRVRDAIRQDHKKVGAHRRHTIAVNETMLRLYEAGITAHAGWRAVLDIPGRTQIKPDLVILAEALLGLGVYYIEVERTAVHPEQVLDKLYPYQETFKAGVPGIGIFITEKPEAELLFRQLGRDLPLLTSTLRDVRRGPLRGVDTVWRYQGLPVTLAPARLSMTGRRAC